jgi:hypothetical protein
MPDNERRTPVKLKIEAAVLMVLSIAGIAGSAIGAWRLFGGG